MERLQQGPKSVGEQRAGGGQGVKEGLGCEAQLRWLKQSTFISHNPGGWEVSAERAGRSGVGGKSTSGFADNHLAVSSWWKKRVLVSSASSKGTNPFMGLHPHDLMVGAST